MNKWHVIFICLNISKNLRIRKGLINNSNYIWSFLIWIYGIRSIF